MFPPVQPMPRVCVGLYVCAYFWLAVHPLCSSFILVVVVFVAADVLVQWKKNEIVLCENIAISHKSISTYCALTLFGIKRRHQQQKSIVFVAHFSPALHKSIPIETIDDVICNRKSASHSRLTITTTTIAHPPPMHTTRICKYKVE